MPLQGARLVGPSPSCVLSWLTLEPAHIEPGVLQSTHSWAIMSNYPRTVFHRLKCHRVKDSTLVYEPVREKALLILFSQQTLKDNKVYVTAEMLLPGQVQ